ncbi:MAG: DUF4115 domain-containing protein, partial [Gammaproteobacteria bacterium]
SYAGQVGLDADALIARLDHELAPLREEKERAFEASPLVDIERRKHRKKRIARGALLALVVVLVALFAVRLIEPQLMQSDTAAPAGDNAAEAVAENSSEAGTGLPSGEQDQPVAGEGEASADQPVVSGDEAVDEESGEEPDSTEATDAVGQRESETPDTSSAVADTSDDVIPAASLVTESVDPALAEDATRDRVGDKAKLEITFVADCWVQVTDADGNRLVSSLKRNGDRIVLNGKPPLKVVVGAVDAVAAIWLNGSPVNIRDFRVVNNRTEFSLNI